MKKKVKKTKLGQGLLKAVKQAAAPDIRIVIAGLPKKGKSTILQIIIQALVEKGLNVTLVGQPLDNSLVVEDWQNKRIMVVKGRGPRIVLEERNMYKVIPDLSRPFGEF